MGDASATHVAATYHPKRNKILSRQTDSPPTVTNTIILLLQGDEADQPSCVVPMTFRPSRFSDVKFVYTVRAQNRKHCCIEHEYVDRHL
jgi:hypothetical protein